MSVLTLSNTWATLATWKHFGQLITCVQDSAHTVLMVGKPSPTPSCQGRPNQLPGPRLRWQSLFHTPTISQMPSVRAQQTWIPWGNPWDLGSVCLQLLLPKRP